MTEHKIILWLALFVGLTTYSFWGIIKEQFDIGIFYTGNSLFIFMICLFLLLKNRNSLICFLLFFIAFNNLLDELFFNPTQTQLNEIILLILSPIIWWYKTKKNARQNNK